MTDQVLQKLTDIEQLLSEIQNGAYESPKGVYVDSPGRPRATPDDIYHALSSLVGLMERQNTLLYNIGKVLCEANEFVPEYWQNMNH